MRKLNFVVGILAGLTVIAGGVTIAPLSTSDTAAVAASKYADTEAIDFKINPNYKVGKACGGNYGWSMLGLNSKNQPAYLKCSAMPSGTDR